MNLIFRFILSTKKNTMQDKSTYNRIFWGFKNTLTILGLSIWCMSLNAQTISTAGGSNYLGNLSINNANPINVSFVIQNTTAAAIVLTDVSTQMGPFAQVSFAGNASVTKLFVSSSSLSGAYDYSTAAWTQIASGNAVVPATLTVVPVISGINFVIPAGAQLRFVLELSKGLRISSTLAGDPMPTPNVFSNGGINLQLGNFQIVGQNIGFGGVAPTAPAGNTPVFFGGSIALSPAVACTGTPTPGNTVSSAANVCPLTNFSLATSTPPAPGTTGITYIWQSGPSATGPWTNITGATNSTLTTAQSVSTFYQALVSCGANTATSVPVQVAMSPVTSCYCAAGATSASFEKITNVTLNTINNNSTATAGYEDFTSLSTSLEPGRPYPISVRVAPAFAADQVIIWIDYNRNGVFTDPGETVYTSPAGFPTIAPAVVSGTLIVPFTALQGVTRMRVRLNDTSSGSNSTSCGTSTYGQVEDYSINILPFVACSGTPTPGNTVSSVPTVCSGSNFRLTLQNFTSGSGVTYQWQSSPSGAAGSYTNIAGATAVFLTRTQTASSYYQAIVTCGANSATSTPIQVLLTPFTGCYCIPPASDCTQDDRIDNVTFGSTLNNNSGCSANGYANYRATLPATDIVNGAANPMSVKVGPGGNEFVAVWIDYNQNGTFDAAEFTLLGSGNGVTITNNINIPASALLGQTGMRVKVRYNTTQTGAQACSALVLGETEDYLVNIVPCVPVTVTTQPSAGSITCGSNATFSIIASGSLPVYQWQFRATPTGIWQNVTNSGIYTGATTASLTLTNVPVTFNGYQYRVLVTGACSASDPSTAVALTVNPLVTTVNPTSASICFGSIQQLSITNTVATAQTATFNATGLPLAIPDGTFPVTTSTAIPIVVSGIPAGSLIQNVGIRFSITHPYVGDLVMNLKAPNNQNLNMFTLLNNGTGTNATANFTNTTIDSVSTLNISGAPAPRSGSYRAEKFVITNPSFGDLMVTNTSWSALFGTINGTWNINVADLGLTDFGSITAASLFVTYTAPNFAQGTWTTTRPGTIFTDPAATTAYTGTPATTVYVKPDTLGIINYNVSFATATCQSTLITIPVTVRSLPTSVSAVTGRIICVNGNTTFTATTVGGSGITLQWQVSSDGGVTYTNIINGGVYSGATTNTLTITGAGSNLNGNRFRLSTLAAPCAGSVNSTPGILTVNPLPVVVLSANPGRNIYPGVTTTLSVAVSPNPGATYTWFKNGVIVPGATGNTLVVNVDAAGSYTVSVNDVNGCNSTSNTVVINEVASDILFIYPSPNTGQFQVRYFSDLGTTQYPRTVNVYDSKGTRVYSRSYSINSPYTRIDVNLINHPKGIYSVELSDYNGNRIKTGRVVIL